MTQAVRRVSKNFIVLEDSELDSLKARMKTLLGKKTHRLNLRHGYTVDENVTKYDNTNDGIRYQGVLEEIR